jgi:hypothetical protein
MCKFFFTIIIACMGFYNSLAAIAFDAKSSGTTSVFAATSLTWSHTVGGGTNMILIVGVVIDAATTVSGITFNTSQNFTQIGSVTNGSLSTELWQLVTPNSGSHSIVVTISGSHHIIGEAHSFSGVDPTTPIIAGHTATASGSTSSACCASTTINNSITSINLEYAVDVIGEGSLTSSVTPSQNAGNSNTLNNGGSINGGGSYNASSGVSASMTWTASWNGSANKWGWVGVSLNPAGGGLPITLTDFTVNCRDKGSVDISWNTQTETNNDYFTIERSIDGIDFHELGNVKGAGNSSTPRYYSYTDEQPLKVKSYYHLKQTDFDGSTVTFYLRSANCNYDDPEISIYPNPVIENTLRLKMYSNSEENIEVEIFNTLGQKVYSNIFYVSEGRSEFLITVPFPKGIYLLKLMGNQCLVQRAFVKETD